jgi:hypothetical protein
MGSVTSAEFPIDGIDPSLNVVEGKVITWDRMTQVCLRTGDGMLAVGQSFGRHDELADNRVGLEIARRNAEQRLRKLCGTAGTFERATVRPRVSA